MMEQWSPPCRQEAAGYYGPFVSKACKCSTPASKQPLGGSRTPSKTCAYGAGAFQTHWLPLLCILLPLAQRSSSPWPHCVAAIKPVIPHLSSFIPLLLHTAKPPGVLCTMSHSLTVELVYYCPQLGTPVLMEGTILYDSVFCIMPKMS